MAKYQVGQVLYVLPEGKMGVVPLLVVEEVSRKTVKGEKITYLAVSPGRDKPFDVERVGGEVYVDLTTLHDTLVTRATEQIAKIIDNAQKIAMRKYGTQNDESPASDLITVTNEIDDTVNDTVIHDKSIIDLGDGKLARLGNVEVGDIQQDLKPKQA